MKLVTYRDAQGVRFGAVKNDQVADLTGVLGDEFSSIRSVLEAEKLPDLQDWINANDGAYQSMPGLDYLPVIPDPKKIICIGLNYAMHVEETGRESKGHPVVFTRYPDSQVGHDKPILLPKVSTLLDYEAELGVIIGKGGRYVPKGEAMDHVAGYSCYNDGSIRDWQNHNIQFTPGKNFPQTGAFGPHFVSADEIDDAHNLAIQCRLNGTVMQDANTSMLLFDIPTLINYVSSFTPLSPGDVIVSGTPGGVGARRNPPVWMQPGDTVEVEIENVGLLRNTIAAE